MEKIDSGESTDITELGGERLLLLKSQGMQRSDSSFDTADSCEFG